MKTRFATMAFVGAAVALAGLSLTDVVAQKSAEPDPTRKEARKDDGKSNQKIEQPKLLEDSYPLEGPGDRTRSVHLLQQLTVDLLATFDSYKQAHWNLTGPEYLQLHEYYQTWADYYRKQSDVFAESRALHMGYSVDGRWSTIARTTKIPDMPAGYETDGESLRLLIARVTVLQKVVYKDISATEKSDPPTSNKLQDLAYAIDKNLWQLRAHLQKPGGAGKSMPWAVKENGDRTAR